MSTLRCHSFLGHASRRLFQTRCCSTNSPEDETTLKGWVKRCRFHGRLVFLDVTDGLSPGKVQVVLHRRQVPKSKDDVWAKINDHIGVEVRGKIVDSIGPDQDTELSADSFKAVGFCNMEEFPLAVNCPESWQRMRALPHLRSMAPRVTAVMRMRHHVRRSAQKFFDDRDFIYVDTPTLTPSDCEGGGEVFQVQAANSKDYFKDPMFLTVSGQMELEMMANAMSKVYTLSPAFRAETSMSSRHLAEFRMLEAEVAFTERLQDLTELTEGLYKSVVRNVLEKHEKELVAILSDDAKDHLATLNASISKPFVHMSYHEALEILNKSGQAFEFQPGTDSSLKTEHERHLIQHCGSTPVFVTDFPALGKAFYARSNDDERETTASFDLLAGHVCELAGGTLREERYDVLAARLDGLGLRERFQQYLDLRRFGCTPHGGFGLGFERLISLITNVKGLRDVTPFPRHQTGGAGTVEADEEEES